MPTYVFKDTNTNEVWEETVSLKERELFLSENPHITTIIQPAGFISGTGMKNDDGWKDMLSRVADANPTSPIADKYGRKDPRSVKTRDVIKKWKNSKR